MPVRKKSSSIATKRLARRRESNRDELVGAARAVALRDGISGFTLEAVAAECGVTKQGLLYHFPSKDALVFEVVIAEWWASADAVADAVDKTNNGADALAAIISAYVGHFSPALDVFRLVTQEAQRYDPKAMSRDRFARIRPLNDRLYAGAEARLSADKSRLGKGLSPRRLAFVAHLAAMGLLAMKALTERFGDPLLYSDAELIQEMSAVFAAAAGRKG